MKLKPETVGFVRGGMLFLEPPAKWRVWQRDVWRCCAERPIVIELEAAAHACAGCRIPMTSSTAEGREDGLYCDRCLEAIVDSN